MSVPFEIRRWVQDEATPCDILDLVGYLKCVVLCWAEEDHYSPSRHRRILALGTDSVGCVVYPTEKGEWGWAIQGEIKFKIDREFSKRYNDPGRGIKTSGAEDTLDKAKKYVDSILLEYGFILQNEGTQTNIPRIQLLMEEKLS